MKTVSIRVQKIILQIKSFNSMMKKIFKNKKATAGLILLVFFAIVAIIGPVLVPDDPLADGSVPNGPKGPLMPVASQLTYPGWYPYLLGGAYTNNIYVTPDPTFSDISKLSLWQNVTTNPEITVGYRSDYSYDVYADRTNAQGGSLQITFNREGNATISLPYSYPYVQSPSKFAIEYSYRIDTPYAQTPEQANVTISIAFSYQIPGTGTKRVFPINFADQLAVENGSWVWSPWGQSSSSSNRVQQLPVYDGVDRC